MLAKLSRIKPFYILAPMDDVTDVVFRQIVADCAPPDLFFTEFVNVDGLQSPGRSKLLPKLLIGNGESLKNGGTLIVAQIWGKNPGNYYKTTKDLIKMGYDGVDINMGCPDKTVVKNGCCSALINNRELAGQIIESVRSGAGSDFPTSVKCRVGFTTIDLAWIEFLLSHKLNMLTIHFRTTKEMSKVPAHWELAEKIIKMRDEISPTTLLVGNGDVLSRTQGDELAKKYQLDGIMIGRGVFSDPFVFSKNSTWYQSKKEEKIELYKKHVKLFAETWRGGERRVPTLNKFCKIYIQGFAGAKELREKLMLARSTDELLSLLDYAASS